VQTWPAHEASCGGEPDQAVARERGREQTVAVLLWRSAVKPVRSENDTESGDEVRPRPASEHRCRSRADTPVTTM